MVSELLSVQSGLLRKTARVAFSASGSSVDQGNRFPPVGSRQASERQELFRKCDRRIPETVDQEWELSFLCELGTGKLVALAFTSILPCLCISRVELSPLRVQRVRLSHSEDVGSERSNVAQSGIFGSSCHISVNPTVSAKEF